MSATTNTNIAIARRANDRARADFATWQMMAKLRSADVLPQEAQDYLASYQKLCSFPDAKDTEAAETIIHQIYCSYYARLGGTGQPPDIRSAKRPVSMTSDRNDNVTPFRKIKREEPRKAASQQPKQRRMPVAAIFIGMVVVLVAYHFISRGGF